MGRETKIERIRQKLREMRKESDRHSVEWPFLEMGRNVSRRQANKFMLGAILDYQIDADTAWENARRFAEDDLGDPPELWRSIAGQWTEEGWNRGSTWRKYRLHHRFPAAHRRVRAIGVDIQALYGGDARRIWDGQSPKEVLCRLDGLGKYGVGKQLSRMIVGALIDTGQIEGMGEFKADTHVMTVLGRLFDGDKATEPRALEIGEELAPGNSWELDGVLFSHGKTICDSKSPRCSDCFLEDACAYASRGRLE